jgi:hypothetical protein
MTDDANGGLNCATRRSPTSACRQPICGERASLSGLMSGYGNNSDAPR